MGSRGRVDLKWVVVFETMSKASVKSWTGASLPRITISFECNLCRAWCVTGSFGKMTEDLLEFDELAARADCSEIWFGFDVAG